MNIIELNGKWQVVEGDRVLHVAATNSEAWGWVDRRHGGARVQRRKAREQMIRGMLHRQRRLLKLRSRQTPYEERLLEPKLEGCGCLCSSNSRRETMLAPQALALPQQRGSLVGRFDSAGAFSSGGSWVVSIGVGVGVIHRVHGVARRLKNALKHGRYTAEAIAPGAALPLLLCSRWQ